MMHAERKMLKEMLIIIRSISHKSIKGNSFITLGPKNMRIALDKSTRELGKNSFSFLSFAGQNEARQKLT